MCDFYVGHVAWNTTDERMNELMNEGVLVGHQHLDKWRRSYAIKMH